MITSRERVFTSFAHQEADRPPIWVGMSGEFERKAMRELVLDAKLKRAYGDKLVFNGGIDSHHVLIDGSEESVRAATKEVLAIMAPGGGYVAGAIHDSIHEETPVENLLAMCDTVQKQC